MLRHADIWRAIDTLAEENGLSASALAHRSGLHPTTFNKSKRVMRDGKLRWPSTESVSKMLRAIDCSLADFVAIVGGPEQGLSHRVPAIGYAEARKHGHFDDAGHPAGSGWDEILFPAFGDPHAYALEIPDNGMEPVYRRHDILIVSPAAGIRRGDRVVVKTTKGEVMARELLRKTARNVELGSVNAARPGRALAIEEIAWMSRILWVSQ